MFRTTTLACIASLTVACSTGQKQTSETAPGPTTEQTSTEVPEADRLGEVHFKTSCDEDVQEEFERGLSRLHHMWYVKARESFTSVAEQNPSCAMAQWGIAMTYYTPLWAPPEPDELEAGRQAVQAAQELPARTQREQDFIDSVAAFYEDSDNKSHAARAEAFRNGWKKAHERDPTDIEAASFHALGILATAPPEDKSYKPQKRAGAILEEVLETEPSHPGGHHYLIHAYDHPSLAEDALEVARNYADIAPAVPHALHMPSHIFVRLGLWDDTIEWNRRSADVAAKNPVDGRVSLHFYHALDYMAYGYLQQARDRRAREVIERLTEAGPPQPHPASFYANAAITARYALERYDWEAASRVQPAHADALPWKKVPHMAAIAPAVRAIGAAKTSDKDSARREITRLEQLREQISTMDLPHWQTQVDVHLAVARATLAEADGRVEEALAMLREAADRQNAGDKHPISPGRIVDADDFLGFMLCENGHHDEALKVYQRALDRSPRRFRAVYGAAISARESGRTEAARRYFRDLLELAADADSNRPEIAEAEKYLSNEEAPVK